VVWGAVAGLSGYCRYWSDALARHAGVGGPPSTRRRSAKSPVRATIRPVTALIIPAAAVMVAVIELPSVSPAAGGGNWFVSPSATAGGGADWFVSRSGVVGGADWFVSRGSVVSFG